MYCQSKGRCSRTVDAGLTQESFTGVGYHDQNWGVRPITESAKSWYWGHSQAGPYSLVWFDVIGIDGQEYVSGYAAWNGLVVQSSCEAGAVKVPTDWWWLSANADRCGAGRIHN
jgi:hypothetical protein